jgi:cytochrome oxidase Cu insertion factor (SCO1/SenC/PrrC family)
LGLGGQVVREYRSHGTSDGSIQEGETKMIATGTKAPGFTLPDHLGRQVSLDQFAGKRHVMLLYYPLDFTPT